MESAGWAEMPRFRKRSEEIRKNGFLHIARFIIFRLKNIKNPVRQIYFKKKAVFLPPFLETTTKK
jgi:hypothetical protein